MQFWGQKVKGSQCMGSTEANSSVCVGGVVAARGGICVCHLQLTVTINGY